MRLIQNLSIKVIQLSRGLPISNNNRDVSSSVLSVSFQLKLTQEERKGNLNSCKLTENWRNLRRDAKTQELKSDVIILKETFDRALQKKNRHIELLLQVFLYCSSRLMLSL
jgi:hypothetical protein